MADDPEALNIWRGLTDAQRRALLWLPADTNMARRGEARRMEQSLDVLSWHRAGPLSRSFYPWWHLTELGFNVRAAGEAEAHDAQR